MNICNILKIFRKKFIKLCCKLFFHKNNCETNNDNNSATSNINEENKIDFSSK